MASDRTQTAAERDAYNVGRNLSKMAGGLPLDRRLNPYRDDPGLAEEFAKGWAAGQAWWDEAEGAAL